MANKITKIVSLALEGDLGPVVGSTSSYERVVETALAGNHVARTQSLTGTWEDIDVGDVDVSKVYEVWCANFAAADATNYVEIAAYDGTNRITVARLLPGNSLALPATPQSSGNPRLQARMNTGTGSVTIKVVEAGTPPAA